MNNCTVKNIMCYILEGLRYNPVYVDTTKLHGIQFDTDNGVIGKGPNRTAFDGEKEKTGH